MNGPVSLRRKWLTVAAGALAVALTTFGVSTMASAHGGDIQLEVGQDGTGKVVVLGTYTEDGHQVEEIMDPYVTAVSSTGQEVGPVRMESGEFGGFAWSTPDPILLEGLWTVTVTTTVPAAATATVELDVKYVEPFEDTNNPAGGGNTIPEWILPVGIGVAGLALIVLVVLIVIRMRSRTP